MLVLVFLVSLLFTILFDSNKNVSFAANPEQQIIISQKQIFQQQERQRQQEMFKRQVKEIKKIEQTKTENADNNNEIDTVPKNNLEPNDFNCITKFKLIEVRGNKAISTKTLKKKVLNKYLNSCINRKNIHSIQDSIAKFYASKNYFEVKIYVNFDDKYDIKKLKQGIFYITIDERIVDDIIIINKNNKFGKKSVESNQIFNKLQTFLVFPFLKGKTFNAKDYKQGLNQINRLQSNNAAIEMPISKKDGNKSSTVYIINQNSFPIVLNLGFDNGGSKNTGENLINMNVSMDNMLGLNDNIYLKYMRNASVNNNKKYNKTFYGSIGIPFGYWTLSTNLNYSKSLATVKGRYVSFNTTGNTLTQTYNIDRILLSEDKLYKINIGANLAIRDTKSYIENFKSKTGSRKSSSVNLYVNSLLYTNSGIIVFRPSYQKGLKLFNSKIDKSHSTLLKTEPRLQYDMVKLYAYYSTKIDLSKNLFGWLKKENTKRLINNNTFDVNYTLIFDSQYSLNTLYGTDQFSIGGEYTVRGFKEETISGDNGYYFRNDLSINSYQLFSRIFYIDNKYLNNFLLKTKLSIFYDYGYVRDKYLDDNDRQYNSRSGYVSGTGITLNYYGKGLYWNFTYAKVLRSPGYLQSRDLMKKEKHSIYWGLEKRF